MWYRKRYYLLRPHMVIHEFYLKTKWFIQRGWRGYSDSDVWNLNTYLSEIIINSCKKLSHSSRGYPEELTSKRWKQKLNCIVKGFEAYQRMNQLDYWGTTEDIIQKANKDRRIFSRGFKVFRKHFTNLWD